MTRRSLVPWLSMLLGSPGCGNLREVSRDAAPACGAECSQELATPGETTLLVDAGCTELRVQIWGAGGGAGTGNMRAAAGGYAEGELSLSPGDEIVVVVGAAGASATGASPGSGGLLGGGNGGAASGRAGGGGGGLSGMFRGATTPETAIVIAGAGGGSGGGDGAPVFAGAGGGQAGQAGGGTAGVAPGTQASGFDLLVGGEGIGPALADSGGGGGAGWFGGFGGGSAEVDGFGGGGGSGYVDAGLAVVLEGGLGPLPGGVQAPERSGAGDPGADGRVVISCPSRSGDQ